MRNIITSERGVIMILDQIVNRRSFIRGALALSVTTILFSNVPSLKALAANGYIGYLSTQEHLPVFDDTNLTVKIGTVYGDEDQITVNFVDYGSNTVNITYPTSSGSKTGYISASYVFPSFDGIKPVSKAKVTTYKWSNQNTEYGYIDVGDEVKVFCGSNRDISQSNRFRVIYPTSSGEKLAWINVSDLALICGESQSANKQNLSAALYKDSAARLTCGFDSYVNTPGKHEGIDFSLRRGAAVYSLTAGEVIRVTAGANGGQLSQIAVYLPDEDKTVIYLHANPEVSTGQRINVGDRIATQDWRGISSSTNSHTHVEMRPGRKTSAAKSVNDYTLENPDPTEFWNNHGYSIG